MKLIFISIEMPDLSKGQGGLYADMLYALQDKGHDVTVVAPALVDEFAGLHAEGAFNVLRVPMAPFRGNIPFYKKGIRIMTMSYKYKKAYKKYLGEEKFDVVMMATPPASFYDVVKLVKQRSCAKFYLMLRDIHPECLDRKTVPEKFLCRNDIYPECKETYGVNRIVEKLLYHQSQALYKLADMVGCMSPGNQMFFKSIAPYFAEKKIVLLPNWYKGREFTGIDNSDLRKKYDLEGKFIAIFGGTIGNAQAVWNIATLAKMNLDKKDVVFLVVGRGVKKPLLEDMAKRDNLTNMRFMEYMPREDYERILELADVGLISIDEKYKVPTCPSKIIGYMALAKPVLAMFNDGNDYGEFYIDNSQCGFYSTDLDYEKIQEGFNKLYADKELREKMGMNGYEYYKKTFTVATLCDVLCSQLEKI